MAKLETLLNEEIKDEFSEVSKLEVGSDKYKVAVDGLAKLCDRAIELEKIQIWTGIQTRTTWDWNSNEGRTDERRE